MKKHLPWLACLALLCAAFGANQIRWQWQGQCVYAVAKDGSRLELGLRDDGVVVWREITNMTNSPAERGGDCWDRLVITNGYYRAVPMPLPWSMTNIILN